MLGVKPLIGNIKYYFTYSFNPVRPGIHRIYIFSLITANLTNLYMSFNLFNVFNGSFLFVCVCLCVCVCVCVFVLFCDILGKTHWINYPLSFMYRNVQTLKSKKNKHVWNRQTFLIITHCYRNYHSKFEIDRTIITWINLRQEVSHTDGQTGELTLIIEKFCFEKLLFSQ